MYTPEQENSPLPESSSTSRPHSRQTSRANSFEIENLLKVIFITLKLHI